MGIPHYFRVITQAYNGIVGNVQPETDHIFFDFNGAIHQSAKRIIDSKSVRLVSAADMYDDPISPPGMDDDQKEECHTEIEREIMEDVEVYVRRIVRLVQPKKAVHIYMDGVAPHAKLMQQRKRRYLSVLRYRILGKDPIWDTNAISPGTLFMVRMGAYLKSRFREEPLKSGVHLRCSFSDENGEAEHKIFAELATICQSERVIVHGLDADLIMLSLLSHRQNITLMREPQDGADFQYLNIDRLRQGILDELSTRYMWPVGNMSPFDADACNAIESYVVWCFFLGNDFLPHMPTLHLQRNGLQQILATSNQYMLVNSQNSTIDWEIVHRVLEELSIEENSNMHMLVAENMRKRCHAKTDEEKVDMYPLLDKNRSKLASDIYRLAGTREDGSWRPMYYQQLFHSRMHDLDIIRSACREYMIGIEWTYRYYKRLARNPEWYYPYAYAPTMNDLSNHIIASIGEHVEMIDQWKQNYRVPTFIPDYVQLLCILPPESIGIIPNRLRSIIVDPTMGCSHMYPRKYPISTFLKTRLWECSPLLPPLDIMLLQKRAARVVTNIEKLKPRAKATETFSKGFHIAH